MARAAKKNTKNSKSKNSKAHLKKKAATKNSKVAKAARGKGKGNGKNKKRRKKVDSSIPRKRRTASSYMIWMNAEGRAQAKARFPEAKVTEVARYCGETWHSMSKSDKSKWVKMAEELKVVETNRYAAAVAAAPPRRKRPPSSYMLWMNEQGREYTKSQYPDLKATEIVSFCGRFWREMPADEKRRWQQKATQLKEAYERGE